MVQHELVGLLLTHDGAHHARRGILQQLDIASAALLPLFGFGGETVQLAAAARARWRKKRDRKIREKTRNERVMKTERQRFRDGGRATNA